MLSRRGFLLGSAAMTAGAWATTLWRPDIAVAEARTRGHVVDPSGTTLERTLQPVGDGFRRFSEGPGWPIELRADLADPARGREDRREAIATVVHLTDVHVLDAQSPTRVEFTDRLEDPAELNPSFFSSAWRPQETLTGQVAEAMAQQLHRIAAGPVTGRVFDCAVSTGDSTDNMQSNEVDWFLGVLDGGRPLQVNSGDPDRYEGVQDEDAASFDPAYWHPDDTGRDDAWKRDFGYPDRPGMLDAAITAFTPVGLPCPWYSVYGNHDGLVQGNALANPAFDAIAVGPLKVVGLPDGLSPRALEQILGEQDLARLLQLPHAPARLVTPDLERRSVDAVEYARRHLDDRGGPGPVGHGLSDASVETGELHYRFQIAPGVVGIAVDSVNRTVWSTGSIDRAQFAWIEQQLIDVSSRYLASDGSEVTTGSDDQLVLLFAHHPSASMDNPFPDATRPDPEERVLGDEFVALLHRFPNVVAFVAGHTHENRIITHPSPSADGGGFYEVTTAAHIDHPQQCRILELVDNRDGTLSLFTTLVDHAGPVRSPDDARTPLELAALSRELGLNDVQKTGGDPVGEAEHRNVELLLAAPFDRYAVDAPPASSPEETNRDDGADTDDPPPTSPADPPGNVEVEDRGRGSTQAPTQGETAVPATRPLPVTGPAAPVAVGAALLGGALALCRRTPERPS